jgi:hypothetical protein
MQYHHNYGYREVFYCSINKKMKEIDGDKTCSTHGKYEIFSCW